MESSKRKIILVRGPVIESDHYCGSDIIKFVESVSDWDEVTDEEYQILRSYCHLYDFQVIERNPKHNWNKDALLRSPKDYIKKHRDDQKEAKERQSKRKTEDETKKLERKRKQLERLKAELGDK